MDEDTQARQIAAARVLAQREIEARCAPVQLSDNAVSALTDATRKWADETIEAIHCALKEAASTVSDPDAVRKIDLGGTHRAIERLGEAVAEVSTDVDLTPVVNKLEAIATAIAVREATPAVVPSNRPVRFDIKRDDNGLLQSVIAYEVDTVNHEDNIHVA